MIQPFVSWVEAHNKVVEDGVNGAAEEDEQRLRNGAERLRSQNKPVTYKPKPSGFQEHYRNMEHVMRLAHTRVSKDANVAEMYQMTYNRYSAYYEKMQKAQITDLPPCTRDEYFRVLECLCQKLTREKDIRFIVDPFHTGWMEAYQIIETNQERFDMLTNGSRSAFMVLHPLLHVCHEIKEKDGQENTFNIKGTKMQTEKEHRPTLQAIQDQQFNVEGPQTYAWWPIVLGVRPSEPRFKNCIIGFEVKLGDGRSKAKSRPLIEKLVEFKATMDTTRLLKGPDAPNQVAYLQIDLHELVDMVWECTNEGGVKDLRMLEHIFGNYRDDLSQEYEYNLEQVDMIMYPVLILNVILDAFLKKKNREQLKQVGQIIKAVIG